MTYDQRRNVTNQCGVMTIYQCRRLSMSYSMAKVFNADCGVMPFKRNNVSNNDNASLHIRRHVTTGNIHYVYQNVFDAPYC